MIKIVSEKKINWSELIKILKNDGIVVYPTDTAYGLAANYSSPRALKKIFHLKKRPRSKKIALIAASLLQVKKFFSLSEKELSLAKKYWPGPLTMILKLKGKNLSVGVRVPDNKIARQIAQKFTRPITATSANISGKGNCYSVGCVLRQFKNGQIQPDLIIDAGRLKRRKVSTLIKVSGNKIKVIRKGPIKI